LSRLPLLVTVEVVAVAAWLALAGALVWKGSDRYTIVPIDPKALILGTSQERWMGIFFEDQQVGFAMNRSTPVSSGGMLYEGRSQFRVATFGKVQEVTTAGTALVDENSTLQRFDFLMIADKIRLVARGEVHETELVMEVNQAGETSMLRFPMDSPPHVGMSIEGVIRQQELFVGLKLEVPYFDPLTLADGRMVLEVVAVEVLENGEEAYWIESRFSEIRTRSLVTPAGETLRQEGALGLSMVRMTEEEAQRISGGAPVDLIAASAVPVDGHIPTPRFTRRLVVTVSGVSGDKVRDERPLQVVDGQRVEIDIPLIQELPHLPIRDPKDTGEEAISEYLAASHTLPVGHPEIRERAKSVVGDAPSRLHAVDRLIEHVYTYVAKEPSIGVPNGLEVLRNARGDCNEHTALFVSLARSVGIPTRIAAGVVYSNRVGPKGAFYYHAWPEVQLGGPTDWVPVDPTFGQLPADATHIKFVEGDLARQVEILGLIGRLRLTVVDVR
jgi:hypothetical protein